MIYQIYQTISPLTLSFSISQTKIKEVQCATLSSSSSLFLMKPRLSPWAEASLLVMDDFSSIFWKTSHEDLYLFSFFACFLITAAIKLAIFPTYHFPILASLYFFSDINVCFLYPDRKP